MYRHQLTARHAPLNIPAPSWVEEFKGSRRIKRDWWASCSPKQTFHVSPYNPTYYIQDIHWRQCHTGDDKRIVVARLSAQALTDSNTKVSPCALPPTRIQDRRLFNTYFSPLYSQCLLKTGTYSNIRCLNKPLRYFMKPPNDPATQTHVAVRYMYLYIPAVHELVQWKL